MERECNAMKKHLLVYFSLSRGLYCVEIAPEILVKFAVFVVIRYAVFFVTRLCCILHSATKKITAL